VDRPADRACAAHRERAYGFPSDFPSDHVESATDYEYVQLGDATKVPAARAFGKSDLPARGSDMCSRKHHRISSNYHKVTPANPAFTYDDTKKE